MIMMGLKSAEISNTSQSDIFYKSGGGTALTFVPFICMKVKEKKKKSHLFGVQIMHDDI